jgi:hypothetical protein
LIEINLQNNELISGSRARIILQVLKGKVRPPFCVLLTIQSHLLANHNLLHHHTAQDQVQDQYLSHMMVQSTIVKKILLSHRTPELKHKKEKTHF